MAYQCMLKKLYLMKLNKTLAAMPQHLEAQGQTPAKHSSKKMQIHTTPMWSDVQ